MPCNKLSFSLFTQPRPGAVTRRHMKVADLRMVPTPIRLPVRDSQSPHSALWDRVGDLAACTFSHGNSTSNSGLCERASELHHHDLIDVLGLRITLVCFALNPFLLESELAVESDSARIVRLHQELKSQHAAVLKAIEHIGQHRRGISVTVKLRRNRERPEMCHMVRSAGRRVALQKPTIAQSASYTKNRRSRADS